jgi:hypothetical protein
MHGSNTGRARRYLIALAAAVTAAVPLAVTGPAANAQVAALDYTWLCLGTAADCTAVYEASNSAAEANARYAGLELVLTPEADALLPNAEPSDQLELADATSAPLLADERSCSANGGINFPDRTGTGTGYRTTKTNGYYYGWTIGRNVCAEWREFNSKGRPGEYRGTAQFEAKVLLGGAGTRQLILGMRNLDGDGFYPFYSYRCRVLGENRSCGSYPHERRSPIFEGQRSQIDFAAAGVGFGPLPNSGPRYDVRVTFSLGDLGEVQTTDRVNFDSDNFGCYQRPNYRECVFD